RCGRLRERTANRPSPASLHHCTAEAQKRRRRSEDTVHPCMRTGGAMVQRHPRWTLLASSFGLAMALVDVTVVNVAVSAIQVGLNTGVRGLSWVIDGYTLAFASLLLLAGGLGDRLGAKRIFLVGLTVFTAASA